MASMRWRVLATAVSEMNVIRAHERGRKLFRERMEFRRVMTVAKAMPEYEADALVVGYLGEKRRLADLDKWAARIARLNLTRTLATGGAGPGGQDARREGKTRTCRALVPERDVSRPSTDVPAGNCESSSDPLRQDASAVSAK
jgi:hypothetical protein